MNLRFQKSLYLADDGINDPGIETFAFDKQNSLARESAQNSNDAGIGELRPVEIDFNIKTIKTSEFPGIEDYRNALDDCIADNKNLKRDNALEALEECKKTIDRQDLSLLLISDRNTTGVRGPFEKGTPFYTLLFATGVSLKPDATAGGSVGLGKNSALSISPLRTVIYSTQFKNEKGKSEFLAMGKTRLTSYTDSDGISRDANGIWGNDLAPVTDMKLLPEWMHRKEDGLTLVIPGIEFSADWAWDYAQTLLRNFFHAVRSDLINFNINNNEIRINAGSIRDLFSNEKINQVAKTSNVETDFKEKKNFFAVLDNSETDYHEIYISEFGKFSMQTLLSDDGLKKFLIVRNGMTICKHLGLYLHRFRETKGFYSLISPVNHNANKNIRDLETAQHNFLSLDKINNKEKREKMETGLKKLDQEIRKRLKEIAGIDEGNSVELNELNEFFSGPVPSEHKGDSQSKPGSDTGLKVVPKVKSSPRKISLGSLGDTGGDGFRNGSEKTSKKSGGIAGKKSGSSEEIIIPVTRSFTPDNDFSKRTIIITPPETGDLSILASVIGYDGEKGPLNVIDCDQGKVVSGIIKIPVEKDIKTKIQITLGEDYAGPTEMKCHLSPLKKSVLDIIKSKLAIPS